MALRCRRPCLASALLAALAAWLWWPSAFLATVSVERPVDKAVEEPADQLTQGVEKPPVDQLVAKPADRPPRTARVFQAPKVRIDRVGQRLQGRVLTVGKVPSGGALVDVRRGRPCLLLLDDMAGGIVEPMQVIEVWVKQIKEDGHVLLTMHKPLPRVGIEYEGQELQGRVVAFEDWGGALIDVGRGRNCLLYPEEMVGTPKLHEIIQVRVLRRAQTGSLLLTMKTCRRGSSSFNVGDLVNGTVTHINEGFGGLFLDVGATEDAMMLVGQLSEEYNATHPRPVVGTVLQAYVIRADSKFQLSMYRPQVMRVRIGDLQSGQELQGRIREIPKTGGAFVDVFADQAGWMPDRDLPRGAKRGTKLTVWVKSVKKQFGLELTTVKPRYDNKELRFGVKMRGNVTGLPKWGGAFVDIGAARDSMLNQADMVGRTPLKEGQLIDVWIKTKIPGSSIQVTMLEPKVNFNDLRRGKRFRGRVASFSSTGGAFIDFGYTMCALLPTQEFDMSEPAPQQGQYIDVWVKDRWPTGMVTVSMVGPMYGQPKERPVRRGIV